MVVLLSSTLAGCVSLEPNPGSRLRIVCSRGGRTRGRKRTRKSSRSTNLSLSAKYRPWQCFMQVSRRPRHCVRRSRLSRNKWPTSHWRHLLFTAKIRRQFRSMNASLSTRNMSRYIKETQALRAEMSAKEARANRRRYRSDEIFKILINHTYHLVVV